MLHVFLLAFFFLLHGGPALGQTGEFQIADTSKGAVGSNDPATAQRFDVIDEKVRRRIEIGEAELRVLILLRSQPQRDVLARHESRAADRIKPLEARYTHLLSEGQETDPGAREARDRLERELLAVRQAAFDEIRSMIQPEQESVAEQIVRLGGVISYRYMAINMLAARIPAQALEDLARHPAVVRIVPDEDSSVQVATSVPSLGAPAFWAAGFTGAGESVAVMDTGLKADHPAFQGLQTVNRVFLDGASADPCFADLATSPVDFQGHGTHVAGIVASRGAPGWSSHLGVARGLGTLYSFKVGFRKSPTSACADKGSFPDSSVLAAVEWAIQNAPLLKVFNYSAGLEANADDDEGARRFDFLADTFGLLFAVSAGNESRSGFLGLWTAPGPVTSPGIGYNVISVASMNTQGTVQRMDDDVSIFSSRGPTRGGRKKPDIAAPGGFRDVWTLGGWQPDSGIYSAAFSSNEFIAMHGTSMAAPHVAGAAALLRQAGVRDPLGIKALLLNTTDTLGWSADKGWGYANLNRAFSQRTNVITGSVSRGRVRLIKVRADGRFYSTLVWNRMVNLGSTSGCLSDLDLSLFDATSGARLSASASLIDNVEKVYADVTASDLILNITHFSARSCRESERFGLALSHGGFQDAAGAVLTLSCTVPEQVAPGSQFSVSCTVRNTGDLMAFSATGQLGLSGSTGASSQSFGNIAPGASATRNWTVTAPSATGSHTLTLAAESTAFGARFSNSASFSFTVTTSTSCTVTVSPTSLDIGAANASVSVSVTAPAGCFWSATSNDSWITFLGAAQGTGNGTVILLIAANTSSAGRTGTVTIGGQVVTIRQTGQSSSNRQRRVLPQLAFGVSPTLGNWSTDLYLHNLTSSTAQVVVSFYGENGAPLSVPKWGASTIVNLPARGTATVDVSSPGALLQGSIHVELPDGVVGYGIFRQNSPGLNPQEGVVPLSSSSSSRSTIVFDETAFVTAVAVANPGGSPVTATIVARDEQGNPIGTATLSLSAWQRLAFALRDRTEFRAIVGKRGSIEFSTSAGAISVLGLRFNGLAFTSILPVEQ